jgi:hypothetical protein
LLSSAIDYAGLFPPANLSMPQAVANYAAYRAGEQAWALGRFIVPVARLNEFVAALDALPPAHSSIGTATLPWRLSALASGADVAGDIARADLFNQLHAERALVDTLEFKSATLQSIEEASRLADGRFVLFHELPGIAQAVAQASGLRPSRQASGLALKRLGHEEVRQARGLPGQPQAGGLRHETGTARTGTPALREFLGAVASAGARAKVRTGGITADSIPQSTALGRFLEECAALRLPFKATAGLHHPIRGQHPLTYEPESPSATMHGFVNVLFAAAFARAGWNSRELAEVLGEQSAPDFQFGPDGASWRAHHLTIEALRASRAEGLLSFGSCSFEEPIRELEILGWLR